MRCVGSLTTIPDRINQIYPLLLHLLKLDLDMVYLNIPYKSMKGKKYIIPDSLFQLEKRKKRFQIIRCTDDGPITKVLPTLLYEKDPRTRIISFDDDSLPDLQTVRFLKLKSRAYPHAALGYSGICIGHSPFVYHRVYDNNEDQPVDWLEGTHCILYCRSFLNKQELFEFRDRSLLKSELTSNDDHWLSGFLSFKNISRIAINKNPYDLFTKLPARFINSLSGKDMSIRMFRMMEEHSRIMSVFKDRGLYSLEYNFLYSIVFQTLLVAVILFITIYFTPSKYRAISVVTILFASWCYVMSF